MKEIGEKLKEAREEIGISVDEAAEDLKLPPSQIEDIESGKMEAFKDIFSLKYFIRDYSKYLGLSYEDMVDEFNEYLFDYTSKISLDDIKKAKKEKNKDEDNKISSPYTKPPKYKKNISVILLIGLVVIILIVAVYFIIKSIPDNPDDSTVVASMMK